ncbi:VanZ family protein [Geomicrobium sp. JSM 1781026]|uniref:VanZ family protein n=1 Tax=Geomicrobium sp. JSM 1781026 TaxID=3344580 RepID=UPI0035C0E9D6
MKQNWLRLILPLVVVLVLIFVSSTMSYEMQDIRPLLASLPGLGLFSQTFGWVSFTYGASVISIEALGAAGFIEFFVRKGTHVAVFAVLAFLVYRLFNGIGFATMKSASITMLIGVGFATFDEMRQAFHPDRSGMWQDVLLDTIGVVIGLMIAIQFYRKRGGKR